MIMSRDERSKLTLTMLIDVLNVLRRSVIDDIIVVSSDPEVQNSIMEYSVNFLKASSIGLNEAVKQASDWCITHKVECLLYIPADVPLITEDDINCIVELCERGNQVVISPSRSGGTNALLRKPVNVIPTFFGSESFRKHLDFALRKRVKVGIYESPRITLDVDSIKDVYMISRLENSSTTKRYLEEAGILDRVTLSSK